MGLILTYKNELGTVTMMGSGSSSLCITAIEGLGLASREYNAAIYSGYDGQDTYSSRAESRSITVSLDAVSKDATKVVRDALCVFGKEGMLYIKNEDVDRRIYCNQVEISDVSRVARGYIAKFVVQFVCDNPFFEDSEDTVVPLYQKTKLLSTPFTLPVMFGDIVIGGKAEVSGAIPTEPVITMHYPEALDSAEGVTLLNETTGKFVKLDYAPKDNDTVTIDIKNRKITSSASGNLINCLTNDSFLGDFVLVRGLNVISLDLGDVSSDFMIECRYNNLYNEAVIV
ncbi:MAG: phage tail family protein [Clostridia bacterium]|nr:phage tail family protein [Clostridia bacterium]